jgi:hypothetical protein
VSQGPEFVNFGEPFRRAVTGCTDDCRTFDGEIEQTVLGFHEHGGRALRYRLAPTGVDGEEG